MDEYISSKELEDIVYEAVDIYLIPRFRELYPNASSHWEEQIEVVAEGAEVKINTADYTEAMVYGRGKGNRPPVQEIESWVMRNMNVPRNQVRSVAFAIANKIAKEGTNTYKKGGNNLLEVVESDAFVSYVENKIGEILSERLSDNITREINRIFK